MRKVEVDIGVALCMTACASLALAEQESVDLLSMNLEDLMNIKVTSSTLTEQSLLKVPSSITVFTRQDIARMGVHTLNELTNFVPGFQSNVTDDSALSNTISSRGRRVGTSSREVLVLVDGQRLNNDWAGGSGQANTLTSIENAERIEFIRGPGSAIYGSNAMMGVINIVTRSERSLRLTAGEYNSRALSAQWHTQFEDLSFDVFARQEDSNGQPKTLFEPFPNPATPVFVASTSPLHLRDLSLRTTFHEFTLSYRHSTRNTSDGYVIGYVDNKSNYLNTCFTGTTLDWQHSFSDTLNLSASLSSSTQQIENLTAISLAPYLLIQGKLREKEVASRWLLQSENDTYDWLVGWEWRRPELLDTAYYYGPPSDPKGYGIAVDAPTTARTISGVFGQYQRALTQNLDITAGIRHDNYSDSGAHTSPRLGLVQQLGSDHSIKLLYSEAYRAPSRIETSVISLAFNRNEHLKPETAKTLEAVWVHTSASGLISLTAFNTHINPAITETVDSNFKRTWVNYSASVSGVELEWRKQWNDNWQTQLALTHLFHPVEKLSTESKDLLGGSISYQHRAWLFTLLANYQGETLDPNEQDQPENITTTEFTRFGGRTLLDLHANWAISSDLQVFAHAKNLLDKDYNTPANRPSNYLGVPRDGRLITLGLNWRFN